MREFARAQEALRFANVLLMKRAIICLRMISGGGRRENLAARAICTFSANHLEHDLFGGILNRILICHGPRTRATQVVYPFKHEQNGSPFSVNALLSGLCTGWVARVRGP